MIDTYRDRYAYNENMIDCRLHPCDILIRKYDFSGGFRALQTE